MMDRLFDMGVTGDRTCRTCAHSTPRHGLVTRNAYPLVCLLKAQAVPSSYGDVNGTQRFDYPCGVGMEGGTWYPRGWTPK